MVGHELEMESVRERHISQQFEPVVAVPTAGNVGDCSVVQGRGERQAVVFTTKGREFQLFSLLPLQRKEIHV